ncbi:patched 2 [Sarotherodon galilaeus]
MEASPTGGGADLAEIRPSCRRALRLARKHTVPSVFLPVRRRCATGRGCAGPSMAKNSAVCFPSPQPDLPYTDQTHPASGGRAMATPRPQGPSVSGAWGDIPSPSGPGCSLGLARERWNLKAGGMPPKVIETIQNARASSTRSIYSSKWRVFEEWCHGKQIIPFQCSVVELLCFLQDLLDKRRAFSTIKVYLAAISACHVGFGDKPAGQHPLVCRFMRGARRTLPVSRPLVPLWDLSVVLDALSHHPFEPIGAVGLKFLSLKTTLLLALTTAKRVSKLQALSIHPSCLQLALGLTKARLRPNPAFVPKVLETSYRCSTVELLAFHPPPFSSETEQGLNTLCPVRALGTYVDRTAGFRKSEQLFVSWASSHKGRPVSRQRLAHWIVEAIALAYSCKGSQAPPGLRAHSTRGVATSWALFRGVSVQDICAAASWGMPHTFVRFYRLDVAQSSLAQAVLDSGASGST